MLRPITQPWFTLVCFAAGAVPGSLATFALTMASVSLPSAPKIITAAVAVTPLLACYLTLAHCVGSYRWLRAPMALMVGLAMPFDAAFVCLAGAIDHSALLRVLACLAVVSTACIAFFLDRVINMRRGLSWTTQLHNHRLSATA